MWGFSRKEKRDAVAIMRVFQEREALSDSAFLGQIGWEETLDNTRTVAVVRAWLAEHSGVPIGSIYPSDDLCGDIAHLLVFPEFEKITFVGKLESALRLRLPDSEWEKIAPLEVRKGSLEYFVVELLTVVNESS